MPIENYDISKLNQKLDKSNNKGAVKMSRKIMIVAVSMDIMIQAQ